LTGWMGTDPATVVTGGRAADLDSVVASIAYAYLLDREGRTVGSVFPYVPISREQLSLRREVESLFEREGVRKSTLVFADDVDLEDLLVGREGELILVDTQGDDLAPALQERVTEVIDHHLGGQPGYAAGTLGRPRPLRRRIVEAVGSTCTLVAEQILHRKPEILDRQLATLLLAAVLLDTANLDRNAGRATVKDQEIAGLLMKAVDLQTADLYKDLVRARRNVEGLSSAQLLAKDYKEGTAGSLRFGMSSVPILIQSWRRTEQRLEEALFAFLTGKELDLLVVLLYRQDDELKRQLIICSKDVKVLNPVAGKLTKPLGLVEISRQSRKEAAGDTGGFIRGFHQRKTTASRKVIEPRLREILEIL